MHCTFFNEWFSNLYFITLISPNSTILLLVMNIKLKETEAEFMFGFCKNENNDYRFTKLYRGSKKHFLAGLTLPTLDFKP